MGTIDIKGDVVDNLYGTFFDYWGIDSVYPKKVKEAIDNDEDGELVLDIASNGGDVFAASEIYTMLKASGKKVTVRVQGLAASAASVIAMAGDVVKMSPTAQIMIHKSSSGLVGNADDMRHNAETLDSVDSAIVNAYKLKTGRDEADILQLMQNETWMNAQKAVDMGFADEMMFVNEDEDIITNSMHSLPSKTALNTFLNMLAKDKATTNNLKAQKLAILQEKEMTT